MDSPAPFSPRWMRLYALAGGSSVDFGNGVFVDSGGGGGFFARSQCSPTATECAHIVPQLREARQGHKFSTSNASLITKPHRIDELPSCTTPLSTGGSHAEAITRSPASMARACLITSQPAIFA